MCSMNGAKVWASESEIRDAKEREIKRSRELDKDIEHLWGEEKQQKDS